jgi:hypothetical protein
MTFISSVLSNQGFTPLPVEICPSADFCGAGRGLSIPAVRKNFRCRSTCNATCNSVALHQFC